MSNNITFSDIGAIADPEGYGATEINAYSGKISHDKAGRSALEIAESELGYDGSVETDEEYKQLVEEKVGDFLKKLAKAGHTSTFYQANNGVNYEVPRHTTMFMCQFDHSKFLQQSQRYTEAKEFISAFEGDSRVEDLYSRSKELYNHMISDEGDEVRKEDARYVLPLATAAKHIHQNLNMISLANMYREMEKSSARIPGLSKKAIEKGRKELEKFEPVLFSKEIIDTYNTNGKGYTVTNMFSETNKALKEIDEPENGDVSTFCKHVDLEKDDFKESFLNLSNYGVMNSSVRGFITSMSLSAWHQFMRNDMVKQSVESVYDAAEERKLVVPPSVKESEYLEEFQKVLEDSMSLYDELKEESGDDAVEVVPHALELDVAFTVDYFNIERGFVKDREHGGAQWEIREIAKQVYDRVKGS